MMLSSEHGSGLERYTQISFLFKWKPRKRTSWSNRAHQSVHLDVPVFDVGARLAKFPLGGLLRHGAALSNARGPLHKRQEANTDQARANVTLCHQSASVHNHSFYVSVDKSCQCYEQTHSLTVCLLLACSPLQQENNPLSKRATVSSFSVPLFM